MNARRHEHEAGVTLIELLVAISILGVLMTALTGALFVGFRSTRDTHTRLDQSNAEQIVTTYVTKDVQASDSQPRVNAAATCGDELVVLETATRNDPVAAASNVFVAYRLDGTNLVRQMCVDGSLLPPNTIARNITSFTASGAEPVSISIATSPSSEVGAYSWSFEVRRRQN